MSTMPYSDLSRDEMCKALSELDQALFHHEQWCEALNQTLICSLSPDQRDTDPDAHLKCRFGQWLYGAGASQIANHPSLAEVRSLHEHVHKFARELLLSSEKQSPILLQDYERFLAALKQMKLEMLTAKHELEDAIYNIDPLTGVSSRVGMLTKLREQQALVQRKVQSCCLAMLDIDHFKVVNDTYGHSVGDGVLSNLARRMKRNMRPYDMLFRYGGEEFLICMPTTGMETCYEALERLRSCVAEEPFEIGGAPPIHVTISIGVTMLDPDGSVETTIERADKALYAAKSSGRNRVIAWDAAMV